MSATRPSPRSLAAPDRQRAPRDGDLAQPGHRSLRMAAATNIAGGPRHNARDPQSPLTSLASHDHKPDVTRRRRSLPGTAVRDRFGVGRTGQRWDHALAESSLRTHLRRTAGDRRLAKPGRRRRDLRTSSRALTTGTDSQSTLGYCSLAEHEERTRSLTMTATVSVKVVTSSKLQKYAGYVVVSGPSAGVRWRGRGLVVQSANCAAT